ncbi:MAG TPA: hypothetical protein VKA21_03495, partial [Candidatus Binatia bacterium]|nr:hypothetical protein [Candidatus Binatia bacterium]
MGRRRREDGLAGLLLLALLLVFFADALRGGRVLSGADLLFATPFFSAEAPPGFTAPANELLFDPVYQFAPWRRFACAALRAGTLPLWNPYSLCGTPFVATLQSAVFDPVNLAACAAPFEPGVAWSAIVRLWIAGFGTYLLLRRYDAGALASLVSATAFMLCGFLVVWLEHPHANVAVWLPALVLLDERLVAAPRPRARDVALLGGAIGLVLLGGHVETAAHVLALVAIYHVVRGRQRGRGVRAPSGVA